MNSSEVQLVSVKPMSFLTGPRVWHRRNRKPLPHLPRLCASGHLALPSVPEQWLSHAIIDAKFQMEGERKRSERGKD